MTENKQTTRNIEPGDVVSTSLLLKEKTLATARSGNAYLTLVLADKYGEIEGKLWEDAAIIDDQLLPRTPVRIEGTVTVYREKRQLTLNKIVQLEWSDELYGLLLPESRFSKANLQNRFKMLLRSLESEHFSKLATEIFNIPEVAQRYFQTPAAKMMHHAYLRGLAEHTLSIMEICDNLVEHYNTQFPGMINRDLLLMGALLHDVGKTIEYSYDSGIDVTRTGRLVGHIILGNQLLEKALQNVPEFPQDLADQLRHLIASHHGDFEKGAPVLPVTAEAILLHHIDYLDSEMNAVGRLLEEAEGEEWTPYSRKFGRKFLNTMLNTQSDPQESEIPEAPEEPSEEILPAYDEEIGAEEASEPVHEDYEPPEEGSPQEDALPVEDREGGDSTPQDPEDEREETKNQRPKEERPKKPKAPTLF